MTAVKGIDIAWARPDVEGIKKTGAHWVARYFSTDPSKNITKSEVAAYTAAGLAVVTVWEAGSGNATKGHSQGVTDATKALAQRKAVGLPAEHVIYFAVDLDTTWAKVAAYFEGVASVLGKSRVGIYGGYKIMVGGYNAGYRFLWQTLAWSNGLWHSHASIRQVGGTVLSGSADIDYSESNDFGQYPAPHAVPTPAPPVTSSSKEVDMILVSVAKNTVPKGTDWPGVFLLFSDGTLSHVTAPEVGDDKKTVDNVKGYEAAGLKAPGTISYSEYLARGGK